MLRETSWWRYEKKKEHFWYSDFRKPTSQKEKEGSPSRRPVIE